MLPTPDNTSTWSELSGSWRFINPFNNRAIRTEGDALEAGENNGSDEAQLWETETDGKFVLLIPTNRPEMAAAVTNGNRCCCPRPKPKATRRHSSKFSWLKHRASTLRSLTASARWPTPNWCWVMAIRARTMSASWAKKVDKQNRGQYWNIKMLDPKRRVVENAFYTQNFDDGGDNAQITWLL